ncbi:hypothetical protein ACP4OV_014650 [Aristida adscensionis]
MKIIVHNPDPQEWKVKSRRRVSYTQTSGHGSRSPVADDDDPSKAVFAAAGLAGAAAGIEAAHLNAAFVSGLLGYALAEHRVRATRGEGAAAEAAPRAPPPGSRAARTQAIGAANLLGLSWLVTLCLAARVAWVSFFSEDGDLDADYLVLELSCMAWITLFVWAGLVAKHFLNEAVVKLESMMHLYCCFIASVVVGGLCSLLVSSPWLLPCWMGVEMMAMAAFLGYMLAVHARCKEIMAMEGRYQPSLLELLDRPKDVEDEAAAGAGEDADDEDPSRHVQDQSR